MRVRATRDAGARLAGPDAPAVRSSPRLPPATSHMRTCVPADWDMFSSRHVAADIHAAARAVSGGPVYVSDAPGSHRCGVASGRRV